jgi:hypothetical protein
MWDPVSMFFMMWTLNVNMPVARLNVHDAMAVNHVANASATK